jgi:hypothetical protein
MKIHVKMNTDKMGPMGVEKCYLVPMSHLLRGGEELGYNIRDPNLWTHYRRFFVVLLHFEFRRFEILT